MENLKVKHRQELPTSSIKFSSMRAEKAVNDSEDGKSLALLKDKSRLNTTGKDNDLAIDIQDALAREQSLAVVVDLIDVTVEGDIVTLMGEVNTEEEIIAAGDIAAALAGEDNLNNCSSIKTNGEHH